MSSEKQQNTQQENRVLKAILNFIGGKTNNADQTIKKFIETYQIDVTNFHGVNLLQKAYEIHPINHPISLAIAKFASAAQQAEALALANRSISEAPTEQSSIEILQATEQEEDPKEGKAEPDTPHAAPIKNILEILSSAGNSGELTTYIAQGGDIQSKMLNGLTPIQYSVMAPEIKNAEYFQILWNALIKSGIEQAQLKEDIQYDILVAGNEAIIAYVTSKGIYSAEELTLKAAKSDKHTNALGTLLTTLPGGIEIYLMDTGKNALHIAAEEGQPGNITKALEQGITVESKTKTGYTALQLAAMANQPSSLEPLIFKGADIFVKEKETGANILHLAATAKNTKMAEKIMRQDAGPGLATDTDSTGKNPVHIAAILGHESVISTILSELKPETKLKVVNALDEAGKTPLQLSSTDEIKRILVENGAKEPVIEEVIEEVVDAAAADLDETITEIKEIDAPQTPGRHTHETSEPSTPPSQIVNAAAPRKTPASALKTPITAQTKPTLEALIKAVMDDNDKKVSEILNRNRTLDLLSTKLSLKNTNEQASATPSKAEDANGINILQLAHLYQKTNALEALKAFWALDGLKELIEAVCNDDADAIAQALKGKVNLIYSHVTYQNTATECAGEELYSDTQHGTTPTIIYRHFREEGNNMSPLHLAVFLNKKKATSKLLECGSFAHDTDLADGYTALHYAVEANNIELVKKLKNDSTALEARSKSKETPAEMAAFLGYTEIFKELVDEKDISYPHLQKAIKGKHIDITKYILGVNEAYSSELAARKSQLYQTASSSKSLAKMQHDQKSSMTRIMSETMLNISERKSELEKLPISKLFSGAIFEAARTKNLELFKVVISHFKSVAFYYEKEKQNNILHIIAEHGTAEMLEYLHTQKASEFNALMSLKDSNGHLPIHIAATREDAYYQGMKGPLSTHTKTIQVKKFFGGFKTETRTEDLSKILALNSKNGKMQTADAMHQHYLTQNSYKLDTSQQVLGDASYDGTIPYDSTEEKVKLLAQNTADADE